MHIDDYLKQMLDKGASDLYFKVASLPHFRVNDQLISAGTEKLVPFDLDNILDSILTDEQKEEHKTKVVAEAE